jgi:hypothetical protein
MSDDHGGMFPSIVGVILMSVVLAALAWLLVGCAALRPVLTSQDLAARVRCTQAMASADTVPAEYRAAVTAAATVAYVQLASVAPDAEAPESAQRAAAFAILLAVQAGADLSSCPP